MAPEADEWGESGAESKWRGCDRRAGLTESGFLVAKRQHVETIDIMAQHDDG
jgi:hypothetical protein